MKSNITRQQACSDDTLSRPLVCQVRLILGRFVKFGADFFLFRQAPMQAISREVFRYNPPAFYLRRYLFPATVSATVWTAKEMFAIPITATTKAASGSILAA